MARRPTRRSASRRAAAAMARPHRARRTRQNIAALLTLLAEKPFEEIGLADVAGGAGVSLAQLRGEFSSTLGILAAQSRPSTAPCSPRT